MSDFNTQLSERNYNAGLKFRSTNWYKKDDDDPNEDENNNSRKRKSKHEEEEDNPNLNSSTNESTEKVREEMRKKTAKKELDPRNNWSASSPKTKPTVVINDSELEDSDLDSDYENEIAEEDIPDGVNRIDHVKPAYWGDYDSVESTVDEILTPEKEKNKWTLRLKKTYSKIRRAKEQYANYDEVIDSMESSEPIYSYNSAYPNNPSDSDADLVDTYNKMLQERHDMDDSIQLLKWQRDKIKQKLAYLKNFYFY